MIICSSQDEEKCPIISKLHLYRRQYGVSPDIAKYRAYLISHFTTHQQSQDMGHLTASIVDHEGYASACVMVFHGIICCRSCVRVVSSNRAGMGKTLFITRMSDKLEREIVNERDGTLLTIPVHGPEVTTDYVMDCLVKHQDAAHCTILHFDISPSVYICYISLFRRHVYTSPLRCCGRLIPYCSLCLYKGACVIDKVVSGETAPHSSMPLKLLYLR